MSTLTNELKGSTTKNNIEKEVKVPQAVTSQNTAQEVNKPQTNSEVRPGINQVSRADVVSARTRAIFNTKPTGIPFEERRNVVAGISSRPGFHTHIIAEKDVQDAWNAGYKPIYDFYQNSNERDPSQMGTVKTVILNPNTGHKEPGSAIGVVMEIPQEEWQNTQNKMIKKVNNEEDGLLNPQVENFYGKITKSKRRYL